MRYENVLPAVFIDRPNRFIARVELGGAVETVHVKNTGRCRELLVPGAPVWVQRSENPARRTLYDLITVKKGDLLLNIDSAAPNAFFGEYLAAGRLFPSPTLIRPETPFGGSRLDFYVEARNTRAFCEVKGVTLEENGAAMFPDAPTLRGVKHLGELIRCAGAGFSAWAVFIIAMRRAKYFTPNRATHPEFADALSQAAKNGVNLLALSCDVEPDGITAAEQVEIIL